LFPSLSQSTRTWILCLGFSNDSSLTNITNARSVQLVCQSRTIVLNYCKINKSSAQHAPTTCFSRSRKSVSFTFVSKPADDDARKCWLIRVHAFEILGLHPLFVSPGYTARLQRIMLTKFQLPGCLHLFSKCPFVYNMLNTGIRLNMHTLIYSCGFYVNCK